MRTIENYMDKAKKAQAISSDRELGRRIGVGPTAPTNWRTHRAWPADATMVALAELAGIDPAEALLELNRWRADSPIVRSVYDRIAHRLAATAAAAVIVAIGVAGSGERPMGSGTVYIMENMWLSGDIRFLSSNHQNLV